MTCAQAIDELVMLEPENYHRTIVLDAGMAGTFELAGIGILHDGRVCIYAGAEAE